MVYSVYLPFSVVKLYTYAVMPYPAKTNAQTILVAAVAYLEQHGGGALSMRVLAKELGLTPRALYRHYPDRAALEAAIAAEGFRQLQVAFVEATTGLSGVAALRSVAYAYLAFARTHSALYTMIMTTHEMPEGAQETEHHLWVFVVELIGKMIDLLPEASANVAVALWAFLHGFIELERANVFGLQKPNSGFEAGLEAFLTGLSTSTDETIPTQ